ncbi:MAG: response regulator transcription factor [Bacteroidetes bacterium]|nr:response regulator transcription factor [Bacteroidota bacterium]
MKPEDVISTNIVIVDDDAEIREGLSWIIDKTEGFTCVSTYGTCAEALKNLEKDLPDVVLMDIGLPDGNGIDCTRQMKKRFPTMQVLMLTVHSDDETIFNSLRAGAVGYILKKTPPAELIAAIRQAEEGGVPMTGEVARKVLKYFKQDDPKEFTSPLSEREVDVLNALIEGHSYKAIGDKLFISPHTVRFHLHNIYAKLHVNTRAEAVAEAMKHRVPGKFP